MAKWIVMLALVMASSKATKVLLVAEKDELDLATIFTSALGSEVEVTRHVIDHEDDTDTTEFCSTMAKDSYSAIVDLSWGSWEKVRSIAMSQDIPYVHVEASNKPFVMALDDFLYQRDAIDAALLFETETELDQSLYHIIGNFHLRVLVLSMNETDPFARMDKLRPVPSAFVAFGTTQEVTNIMKKAKSKGLVKRDSRWNFMIEDFESPSFAISGIDVDINIGSITPESCCGLIDSETNDPNTCLANCKTKPKVLIVKKAGQVLGTTIKTMTPKTFTCDSPSATTNGSREDFGTKVVANLGTKSKFVFKDNTFTYPLEIAFVLANKENATLTKMATWSEEKSVQFDKGFVNIPLPRYFRVGMAVAIPWLFPQKDKSGKIVKDDDGNIVYDGYCMDLLKKIAEKLKFEFDVVITEDDRPGFTYGKKLDDGSWTGMIADLAKGETDLIVADLTMTSEREEVIDFVSPYFDQAGISIVLRKKYREQSLFRFLTVLKKEVWLGIVAAVVITALLIWLLDRYSPYSARNNKQAYPYPCRDFTLKESFWFALTSLTPQGGGEAPKALSGRVLVAAYWLFVVLMLATFTANLAAFLTVERMQTTVQSLEELAKQSKINYTVVENTTYMEYFVNMAGAEEELYHKWKELTLNSSGNPAKYRVWDYPIREQYTHILNVIRETGPVDDVDEGFEKVLANLDGEYAFIHDAARIRYEVYNNCNLTEIGEPFAEQPYALAVQQGSHLQEELSRVILELQKERYFESLQSRYWNSSLQSDCPVMDDSDGITLQSLGGVFIATLIGLGLALLTLAVEVVMQRRKDKKNRVRELSTSSADGSASGSGPRGLYGDKPEGGTHLKFRIGSKELPAIIGN